VLLSLMDGQWNIRTSDRKFLGLTDNEESEWKGPFFFVQFADTQFGFMNENDSWDEELKLAQQSVKEINRLKPRFAIICGDLVHKYPEANPTSDIRSRQVTDFKNTFSQIHHSIPLLCVCGNHDVGNKPDKSSIEIYKTDFGDDYFSFWVGGVFGVAINSNLLWNPSEGMDLYNAQYEWLEHVLQEAKKKKILHIYWSLCTIPSF